MVNGFLAAESSFNIDSNTKMMRKISGTKVAVVATGQITKDWMMVL